MKLALLAAAAALAAPVAFAQSTTVQTTTTTTTAPGVIVSTTSSPVSQRPLPGAVIAQGQIAQVGVVSSMSGPSTNVLGASGGPVTRYWFNVPSNVARRGDFQRWQRLL